MKFCSVSAVPGRTGTFFYNYSFEKLGISGEYIALKCKNLAEVSDIVKSKNFDGVSVSMPFKSEVHVLCDEVDETTNGGQSINTIKVEKNGKIMGFSTDSTAADQVISTFSEGSTTILGSGSMAKLFSHKLRNRQRMYEMFSRKQGNWRQRNCGNPNIVNCTSIGMDGTSIPIRLSSNIQMIVDLPIGSMLFQKKALENGIRFVSGLQFYLKVFERQFQIYTNSEISTSLLIELQKEWNEIASTT